MAWLYIVVRVAGSALVVPPIQEVFYRSFLYRYLANARFQAVPFNQFHARPFVVTAVVFGLAHPERWLAAILCGLAYQGLALRRTAWAMPSPPMPQPMPCWGPGLSAKGSGIIGEKPCCRAWSMKMKTCWWSTNPPA